MLIEHLIEDMTLDTLVQRDLELKAQEKLQAGIDLLAKSLVKEEEVDSTPEFGFSMKRDKDGKLSIIKLLNLGLN